MAYKYRGVKFDAGTVMELPTPEARQKRERPIFDPARCGTAPGYKQHQTHGIEACPPCTEANAAYHRDYRARRKQGAAVRRGFRPDKCGTYPGYARHTRSNVPPCDPCEIANAEYMKAYRAKRKAA